MDLSFGEIKLGKTDEMAVKADICVTHLEFANGQGFLGQQGEESGYLSVYVDQSNHPFVVITVWHNLYLKLGLGFLLAQVLANK